MQNRFQLAGKNIVVFDLETKEECGTPAVPWARKDLMGISVGVAFHYLTMEYLVFMDDNLPNLAALLASADLVTGFNINDFDIPLLRATLKARGLPMLVDEPIKSYDLLLESRKAAGWTPNMPFPKGMRLDDHLLATFGKEVMKTGDGANAPALYQAGKLGELVSYCIADVKREALLFEHVAAGCAVKTPTHGWRLLADPFAAPVEARA